MRFTSFARVTAGLILTTSLATAQAAKTFTGTGSDAVCGRRIR